MKVELMRKEEITGKVWYIIYVDGDSQYFSNEPEATAMFNLIKEKALTREYPIIETIDSFCNDVEVKI